MEKNSFLYSSALKESKACCYSFPEQTFSEPTARSILVRLGSPRTTSHANSEAAAAFVLFPAGLASLATTSMGISIPSV